MKLDTVPVYVHDQDTAMTFWTDTIGFGVVRDTPMGPDQRWLEVAPAGSAVRLVLYKATPDNPGADSLRTAEERIGSFTGYVFSTEDIIRDRAELGRKGVAFTMEPDPQPWGIFAIFADPDGNSFGLLQPPPATSQQVTRPAKAAAIS